MKLFSASSNPIVLESNQLKKIIRNVGLFFWGTFTMVNHETNWVQWIGFSIAGLITIAATLVYLYELAKEKKKPEVIFHLEILIILTAAVLLMTMQFIEIEIIRRPSEITLLCFLFFLLTGGIWLKWWFANLPKNLHQ